MTIFQIPSGVNLQISAPADGSTNGSLIVPEVSHSIDDQSICSGIKGDTVDIIKNIHRSGKGETIEITARSNYGTAIEMTIILHIEGTAGSYQDIPGRSRLGNGKGTAIVNKNTISTPAAGNIHQSLTCDFGIEGETALCNNDRTMACGVGTFQNTAADYKSTFSIGNLKTGKCAFADSSPDCFGDQPHICRPVIDPGSILKCNDRPIGTVDSPAPGVEYDIGTTAGRNRKNTARVDHNIRNRTAGIDNSITAIAQHKIRGRPSGRNIQIRPGQNTEIFCKTAIVDIKAIAIAQNRAGTRLTGRNIVISHNYSPLYFNFLLFSFHRTNRPPTSRQSRKTQEKETPAPGNWNRIACRFSGKTLILYYNKKAVIPLSGDNIEYGNSIFKIFFIKNRIFCRIDRIFFQKRVILLNLLRKNRKKTVLFPEKNHKKKSAFPIGKAESRQKKWRRGWDSNPHITVLQTVPLAL